MRRARRLICVLHRPYRLAPQLDALDDGECRLLIAHTRELPRGESDVLDGLLAGIVAFPVAVVGCFLVVAFAPAAESSGAITSAGWLGGAFVVAITTLTWALANQLAVGLGLQRMAHARIRRRHCVHCSVILTDLAPNPSGLVVCPNCSRPYVDPVCLRTADQIITCAQWRPPPRPLVEPQPAGDRVCTCGYPLRGLPVENSLARCPECGMDHRVAGEAGAAAV